jgi:hypothetical protein
MRRIMNKPSVCSGKFRQILVEIKPKNTMYYYYYYYYYYYSCAGITTI